MKVAANSREEAEQFARDQWKRGEVVLDASHFTGVEFHLSLINISEPTIR